MERLLLFMSLLVAPVGSEGEAPVKANARWEVKL